MKNVSICVLAMLAANCASAGSLDVYGDIKVNGKTVINAKGELAGNAATTINKQDYFNNNGLKKTFSVVDKRSDSSIMSGKRIEDYTVDGINRSSYIYYDQYGNFQSNWVIEETHETPSKLLSKGFSANEDGSSDGGYYYNMLFEHRLLSGAEPDVVPINGSYTLQYEDTRSSCTSSDANCEMGEATTTNITQVVTWLGKTRYVSGDHAYDDCVVTQYNSSDISAGGLWTTINCKGVGLVKGWSSTYVMTLDKVEGGLKPASKQARSQDVPSLVRSPR